MIWQNDILGLNVSSAGIQHIYSQFDSPDGGGEGKRVVNSQIIITCNAYLMVDFGAQHTHTHTNMHTSIQRVREMAKQKR